LEITCGDTLRLDNEARTMRGLLLPCNITAGYFDRRIVLIAVYFGSTVQLRYQGGLYLQYSAISLCILLSPASIISIRFEILSIRFEIPSLLLIRTATTINAPIATAMYSGVIKRQSARATNSHNLSYGMRSSPHQDRNV
jgi:hypothetical protein